jgi:2-polyprenyl-3-methyl-5-hydroxy-6-metoxy-1,4-benzoquinol methylase
MQSADREYWEERARRHGTAACGCLNPIEYRYEERLRWDAFQRLVRPRPGWDVLDIGCGVGTWSRRIAELGSRVVGADFSAEMIKMAAPAPGVEFKVGSAQDLDLPGGKFDLVLSVTVLQHITAEGELERALANIHRMLKDGGRFFLLEYSPKRLTDQQARASHMRYRTRDEWIEECKLAGLELVRVTGVRYIGHRVLGAGVARWRRWRRRDPAEAESAVLTGPEVALNGIATSIDLIAARVPGTNSVSDLHAFLFVRRT